MNLILKALISICGLVLIAAVLRGLKKNTLHPSYAILWTSFALVLESIALLSPFYRWLAVSLLGLTGADHLIYFTLLGFLSIYVFYLTLKICVMNDRIQRLISHTAILDHELERMRNGNK